MYSEAFITHENLNEYLKALAKEFRRLNGTAMPAEIILIGGAAILMNYRFREMTYDVDAVIVASSAMKEAINRVGDRYGLPNGWLNTDFTRTKAYSEKLFEVSVYYKTFSNTVTVRMVAGEYLVAMKLMSGRRYKNDLSDIVGILWEHEKSGNPLTREAVDHAIAVLYGASAKIPEASQQLIDKVFIDRDYEMLYKKSRETEILSKEVLLNPERDNPNKLSRENANGALEVNGTLEADRKSILESIKTTNVEGKTSKHAQLIPIRKDKGEHDI